ncbi:MAG: class IV adenylate cyclase [Pyrinomonadaceae bacterium]
MGIEIEKKYRIDAALAERVRHSLREAGAERQGEVFEENTIYRGGVLDAIGGVFRIRRIDGGRGIFTFKRRIEHASDAKTQVEHETEVADPDELAAILAEAAFEPRLVYEKRRETWSFRKVEIVIDELPFGMFMEIEGSLTGIREAELLLDLDDLEVEHETYPRLTLKLGERRENIVEARFKRSTE